MSVVRYTNWCRVTHGHEMMEHEGGPWVAYPDYYHLLSALQKIASPDGRFEGEGECEAIARAALAGEVGWDANGSPV